MTMPFYVQLKSQKQGILAGDSMQPHREDWTQGISFRYELISPRDPVTGMATGKHQHALTFTKRWSRASAQLFSAAMNNELLSNVIFEFVWPANAKEDERVFQRITVEAASIASMRQSISDADAKAPGETDVEEIGLAIQSINLDYALGVGSKPTLTPIYPAPDLQNITIMGDSKPKLLGDVSGSTLGYFPTLAGNPSVSGGGASKWPPSPPTMKTNFQGTQLASGQAQLLQNPNLPKWGRFAPAVGPSGGALG
jgi:type VI secretion system secreted protein Hcp